MMERIESVEDLAEYADKKRSVISPSIVGLVKPKPAVIVLNMPAALVIRWLAVGLYLYEKPQKKTKNPK